MKITSDIVCKTKYTYFASHWFHSMFFSLVLHSGWISIHFFPLYFLDKSIIKSVYIFRSLLGRKRFSCKWNLGCILLGIHSRKALQIFLKIFLLLKWLLITNNMGVDLLITIFLVEGVYYYYLNVLICKNYLLRSSLSLVNCKIKSIVPNKSRLTVFDFSQMVRYF